MSTPPHPLILGSASPRRRRLLAEAGISFHAITPSVDEVHDDARPQWTIQENAGLKLAWCRQRYPENPILTADTVVVFGGQCISKPRDLSEAYRFLEMFSGNEQDVFTAVCLWVPGEGVRDAVVTSRVRFKVLTDETIRAYLERVRPLDRAGAYDIDEEGSRLIAGYDGSYTNIVGLPMECVLRWLAECGL